MRECGVRDCNKPRGSRGLCGKHYYRLYSMGSPHGRVTMCAMCGHCFWASDLKILFCSTECKKHSKYYYNRAFEEEREEEYREYHRKYREANRERLRLASRRRYREDPDRIKVASHEDRVRRSRVVSEGYTVSLKSLRRCLERYGHACAYCGRRDSPLQWDHVYPISRGGINSEGNLLPACSKCNSAKRARTIMEWRMGRSYRKPRPTL